MDNEAILECLEQKRALFAQYEKCTSEMCVCDTDALDHYITERARLANEIDTINQEIENFCDDSGASEELREAVANRGNYGEFSPEARPVYDKAAQIFTIINHVYNMEPQIKERMAQKREELLAHIKKGSDTAKVYNYVKGMQQTGGPNVYLSNKKI